MVLNNNKNNNNNNNNNNMESSKIKEKANKVILNMLIGIIIVFFLKHNFKYLDMEDDDNKILKVASSLVRNSSSSSNSNNNNNNNNNNSDKLKRVIDVNDNYGYDDDDDDDNDIVPYNQKILTYMHFHKSGGTNFCSSTKRNGPKLIGTNNCNIKGDGPRMELESFPTFHRTCKERYEYLRKTKAKIWFIERWLRKEMDWCPQYFRYGTIIRDPLSRIISSSHMHQIQVKQVSNWLTTHYIPNQLAIYNGTAAVDNFHIRVLCGEKCFHKEVNTINEKDLECAKARLSKFEIIMNINDLTNDKKQLQLWKYRNIPTMFPPQRYHDKNQMPYYKQWTNEMKEFVKSKNLLDYELYEYGLQLAKERSANF